jgi:DNA-binding NarL/FixJ family response regulator
MIRVAVVDDHPHIAIALHTLLDEVPDIQLVAESRRGSELANFVRKARPDVLLLDLLIDLKVCLLSAYLEPTMVRDLLQTGAYGYILKDDDYVSHIDTIVRDLAEGEIYLSPQAYEALAHATRTEGKKQVLTERELDVLRLANRGLPNPQIAQALHISPGTVRNHLSAVYRKLGVHSRYEALQIARDQNLI